MNEISLYYCARYSHIYCKLFNDLAYIVEKHGEVAIPSVCTFIKYGIATFKGCRMEFDKLYVGDKKSGEDVAAQLSLKDFRRMLA